MLGSFALAKLLTSRQAREVELDETQACSDVTSRTSCYGFSADGEEVLDSRSEVPLIQPLATRLRSDKNRILQGDGDVIPATVALLLGSRYERPTAVLNGERPYRRLLSVSER